MVETESTKIPNSKNFISEFVILSLLYNYQIMFSLNLLPKLKNEQMRVYPINYIQKGE